MILLAEEIFAVVDENGCKSSLATLALNPDRYRGLILGAERPSSRNGTTVFSPLLNVGNFMFRQLFRYTFYSLGLCIACSVVSPRLHGSCGDYLLHHGSSPATTSENVKTDLDVNLGAPGRLEMAAIHLGQLVPSPSRPCTGPFCSGQPTVPSEAPAIPVNLDSRYCMNQMAQGLHLDSSRASRFYMTDSLYLLETAEDIFHPPRYS